MHTGHMKKTEAGKRRSYMGDMVCVCRGHVMDEAYESV